MEPTPAELSLYVQQHRLLRAIALKHNLNPDTALPEDLLLLSQDKDGKMLVSTEFEKALKWVQYEQKSAN